MKRIDRTTVRDPEEGAALIYVLLLLVLTITAGLLIATSLAVDSRTRKDDARRLRAGALVDSAVVEAMAELAVDPDARGYEKHPFGGGEIESDIRATSASQREIHARGAWGGFERRVLAEVVLESTGPRIVGWGPDR